MFQVKVHTLFITTMVCIGFYISPLIISTVPQITSISPTPTSGGITTIVGSNFGANIDKIDTHIGGLPCRSPILVTEHTTIACEVPAGVGENLIVVLTVDDQQAVSMFEYAGISFQLAYFANY